MAWKKGECGNLKGRPSDPNPIKKLARQYAPEALATLLEIARNGDTSAARVAASNALLDRAYGKPVQAIESTVEVVKYVVRAPEPAKTANDWSKSHSPKHVQ